MKRTPGYYNKLKARKREEASNEIKELFLKAEKAFKTSPAMADRQVKKARRLAMKHKLRMPRELKRRYCKHCYRFLVPSVNSRVRLVNRKVVYYCLGCRKYMRFPYIREQKEKRARRKQA